MLKDLYELNSLPLSVEIVDISDHPIEEIDDDDVSVPLTLNTEQNNG